MLDSVCSCMLPSVPVFMVMCAPMNILLGVGGHLCVFMCLWVYIVIFVYLSVVPRD